MRLIMRLIVSAVVISSAISLEGLIMHYELFAMRWSLIIRLIVQPVYDVS